MARMTIKQLLSENSELRSANEALRQKLALLEETKSRKAQAPSNPSERRNLMHICKLISATFACTTRINAGVVEYFKPSTREWLAVPNARIEEVLP